MNYYKEKIGENYKDEIQVEVNYSFEKSSVENLIDRKLTDEEWKQLVENWDDECVVRKMDTELRNYIHNFDFDEELV